MNYLLSALNMSNSDRGNEAHCPRRTSDESTQSLPAAAALKIRVFLRIRPANPAAKNKSQADVYRLDGPESLLLRHCNSNDSARRSKASSEQQAFKKFSFERIFEPQVDQALFFSEAIEPALADFLNNQNSSSFVGYGCSDAGKTYTLFGPIDDPGIVPRSIQFIFSSIKCSPSPCYKPVPPLGVVPLEEPDRHSELQARNKLLTCRTLDRAACGQAYALLQARQPSRTPAADASFSVWISFVEIYNEVVSDLLDVDEDGKNATLKLSTDKHGSTYVQGMQSLCATTGLEAYEILNAGQMRLTTVSASNYKSSRSHSIFSMTLLKYDGELLSSSAVQASTISFYDLAGSGKMQKSASNDKQFIESRCINTSLLAFGRCLKALAEAHSRQSSGPFRDSKLTRLFQHSLRKENLIILVNLNPSSELLAETQNVLNFASTAMKLTSELAKEDKRSLDYQSPLPSPKLSEAHASSAPRSLRHREIHQIVAKNKQLQDQIKELKSAELTREYTLRQDLADFYSKQLNDLEDIWKNRMSAAEEEKECLLKFSLDTRHSKLKQKTLDRQSLVPVPDAKAANAQVFKLEKFMKALQDENKQLALRNEQYALEVSWLSESFNQINDLIASAGKRDGGSMVDYFATKSFEFFDNETISHIRSIAAFLEEQLAKHHYTSNSSSTEVQCDLLNYSSLDRLCEKIDELFSASDSDISLAELDDSMNSLHETVDRTSPSNFERLLDRLSRVKQSVVECLTDRKALLMENADKEEESVLLRRTIEQQHIEILGLKQELAESESSQMSLLKRCENLELASKSREFFKNPDFDAVESESSLSCALHRELIRSEKHDDSFEMSTLTFDSINADRNATTSSSDSSKHDSGVALSLDSVAKEDKYCQTDADCSEDQNRILKDKLIKLNVDYTRMEAQHLQGSTRITELSLELERIREAMLQLKDNTYVKDRTISECQSKLNDKQNEIDRLSAEKSQLEMKFDELRDNLLLVSKDYERKLAESQVKLKVHEEGEQRAARCLKDYWDKSVNLGSELSMAYSELEKYSIRCYQEHVLKIYKLEEELNEKKVCLANLNEQMCVYEKDLAEMIVLSGKVEQLENVLIRLQQEKSEVEKVIASRSESQSTIQNQLKNLTEKIGERDSQILSLKWQLDTIIKANLSNSRKAKELGREVTKLIEKICSMKEDITESETARTELERKSSKEIDNLRARLTIFEGNADLLSLIRNSDESKQCEMDKLKLKVLEKEKELEFFKKNRNATIQRYECLVKQLQAALKMNNPASRMKKLLARKERCFANDLKETTSCHVRGCRAELQDWKIDEKSRVLMPSSSMQMIALASERYCNAGANGILLDADRDYLEARANINSVCQMSRQDSDTSASSLKSCLDFCSGEVRIQK